jgi:hypothetical protein
MFAPRSCNAIVHRIAQFGVVALEDEACVLWLENFLAFVTDLVASDISLTELLLMEVNFQKKETCWATGRSGGSVIGNLPWQPTKNPANWSWLSSQFV